MRSEERKKTIKIIAEVNKTQNRKTIKEKSAKPGVVFLERATKLMSQNKKDCKRLRLIIQHQIS